MVTEGGQASLLTSVQINLCCGRVALALQRMGDSHRISPGFQEAGTRWLELGLRDGASIVVNLVICGPGHKHHSIGA